jgi:preprotein translocase subunit SecD
MKAEWEYPCTPELRALLEAACRPSGLDPAGEERALRAFRAVRDEGVRAAPVRGTAPGGEAMARLEAAAGGPEAVPAYCEQLLAAEGQGTGPNPPDGTPADGRPADGSSADREPAVGRPADEETAESDVEQPGKDTGTSAGLGGDAG